MNDNLIHRALFTLPGIQLSTATGLAVPTLPVQRIVTGDNEVDAVIWLREVIGTGQPALIAKAKKAAKKIKTPFKDLEKRYSAFLARTSNGHFFATFAAVGFSDLEGWEKTSIEMAARRQEAHARFGDALFENTAAETFSEQVLAGAKQGRDQFDLDKDDVDSRFDALTEQRPTTLADCLLELKYWDQLYWLRNAVDRDSSEGSTESYARKNYTFRCLGRIQPRSTEEAHQVLQYMIDDNAMDWEESFGILRNLMTQASASQAPCPTGGSALLTRGKLGALELAQHRACELLEATGEHKQVEAAGALRSAMNDMWEAVDEQLAINALPLELADWMKTPAGLLRVLVGELRNARTEESGKYNDAVEDCIVALVGTISAGAGGEVRAPAAQKAACMKFLATLNEVDAKHLGSKSLANVRPSAGTSGSGPDLSDRPDLLQPKVSIEEVAELLGQLDELCDKDAEDELTALRRRALHVIGGLLAHAGAGVLA